MAVSALDQTPVEEKQIVFLLTEKFSLIAFAAAIEPLRLANRLARRNLYAWRLLSETGNPVGCSNGSVVAVDADLEDAGRDSIIFVCSGEDVHRVATRPVLNWLRRQERRGVSLGSLCTGAHVLAMAGLLDGRTCTIHWENKAAFEEEFLDVQVSNLLFVVDGDRYTCAGGTAGADMMLQFIAEDHGPDLAALVSDYMIHPPLRSSGDEQRLSVPARIGVRHPKLVTIIQMMEENIEEPISPSLLAKEVGMSTRQLERLFRRYLDRSPKRYYMELRLERARHLLLQTNMSVINVALACGFTSPSHFSKCYRTHYSQTPYRERGASGVAAPVLAGIGR